MGKRQTRMAAKSRHSYWFTSNAGAVKSAITNERIARAGKFGLFPGI